MPELFPQIDTATPVTLDEQIAEARRELQQRHRVYPRLTAAGKLPAAQASRQIRVMDEIIRTLVAAKAARDAAP